MMACQFIRWTEPRSIVTSGSLGTMGFGLPSAIGAQVANPDKTVLLIDGDGSFNMTLNDLGTVLENQLPLKMAIMNDHKQQMVVVWQKLFFDGRTVATNNVNPDFVALAQAYGIEAFKCDHTDDLPAAIARLAALLRPGGSLIFSTMGQGSFARWRAAHAACGLEAGVPDYPSLDALRAMLRGHADSFAFDETVVLDGGGARELIAHLKGIGAVVPSAGCRPLAPAQLRAVMAAYEAQGGADAYQLLFGRVTEPA